MKMPFRLDQKTAIITGGSNGIGESIAKLFANQGAHVHILDIDEEGGKRVTKEINANNGIAKFHHCDVSKQSEINSIFESLDRLDILINNAAVAHIGNVLDTSEEDLDRLYQINIKSVYNCLQAGVKKMQSNNGGVILNMASVASILGIKDRFAYSTSKGAVLTMTYSIAKDFIQDNIRCNAIGPGRVHTPFVDGYLSKFFPGQEKEKFAELSKTQPIGRMGKPEEIAHLALYLCSDEAAFITGSFYPIDGGFITLNT